MKMWEEYLCNYKFLIVIGHSKEKNIIKNAIITE
jgi:hypothetical protein